MAIISAFVITQVSVTQGQATRVPWGRLDARTLEFVHVTFKVGPALANKCLWSIVYRVFDPSFDPATSNDYAQLEPQLAAAVLEVVRDIVIGVNIFQTFRIKRERDAQHLLRMVC